jgi:beta-glucosidase
VSGSQGADAPVDRRFPEGFWWGTATAGHQIEGGNSHSNWWEWEKLGLVDDGTVSGRACDYWNRWAEDHDLLVELGQQGFRLGVEWARLEPSEGTFDDEALAQYVAMVADLQAKGLKVCLTLNHWVLPNWFAEIGGWLHPRAIERWERFVAHVVPALAPHVDLWVTLNEPMVPVLAGYLAGYHPPTKANPWLARKVFCRLLEAHAVAYHLVHGLVPRAPGGGPTMVGYANAYQAIEPYHEGGPLRPLEAVASKVVSWVSFDAWDHAVRTGLVPFPMGLGRLGPRIARLAGTADFVGVNYYMRISVRLNPSSLSNVKSGEYDAPPGIETTEMGWQIYPPGFRAVLDRVSQRLDLPIFITENGCCDSGDDLRRAYLVSHLAAVHDAIADGADVRGYMHWTFMDNFEWREGFAKRFGLVEMDHTDPALTRRPRQSAAMMRTIIEGNALTQAIVDQHAPGALDRFVP